MTGAGQLSLLLLSSADTGRNDLEGRLPSPARTKQGFQRGATWLGKRAAGPQLWEGDIRVGLRPQAQVQQRAAPGLEGVPRKQGCILGRTGAGTAWPGRSRSLLLACQLRPRRAAPLPAPWGRSQARSHRLVLQAVPCHTECVLSLSPHVAVLCVCPSPHKDPVLQVGARPRPHCTNRLCLQAQPHAQGPGLGLSVGASGDSSSAHSSGCDQVPQNGWLEDRPEVHSPTVVGPRRLRPGCAGPVCRRHQRGTSSSPSFWDSRHPLAYGRVTHL